MCDQPQIKLDPNHLVREPHTVSLCRLLQKREKRKEEEQRRKEWVDQEREKTLSRLRSFREVRLGYCLYLTSSCSLPSANTTSEASLFLHLRK